MDNIYNRKKRILVIGKNGFISKNLSVYLKKSENYDIRVVSSADLNILDELSIRHFLYNDYYDVIIDTAIYNPRIGSYKDPNKELEYDLLMFHNLAKNHNRYGRLIYFGSGAEYDKRYPICSVTEDDLKLSINMKEDSEEDKNVIKKQHNIRCSGNIPTSQYGLAKYIIGQEIESGIYGAENIYNLRIFGLFGKYENWKKTFISGACCKALNNLPITIRQNVYFDYLYIRDFCKMLEKFINIERPKFHTYNITSGQRVSLFEIANLVNKISENNVPIYICNKGLGNEYTSSNKRIIDEIGGFEFEPMSDSIKDLYGWYESIRGEIDIESLLYQ